MKGDANSVANRKEKVTSEDGYQALKDILLSLVKM